MDVSHLRLCCTHQTDVSPDQQASDCPPRYDLFCLHTDRRIPERVLFKETRLLPVGLQQREAKYPRCHTAGLCPVMDGRRTFVRADPWMQKNCRIISQIGRNFSLEFHPLLLYYSKNASRRNDHASSYESFGLFS